jgi:chloride channel protein, CIC family
VSSLVHRAPAVIFEDSTLREAADQMVHERVGRLPVVTRTDPNRVVGVISRSDLLAAHGSRLEELHHRDASLFGRMRRAGRRPPPL